LISPIVINDITMLRKVTVLGYQKSWIVDGIGGACVMVPSKAFGIRFDKRTNYAYEDAAYHSACSRAGLSLMVMGVVSAVHLPWIVMLDADLEAKKLSIRHEAVTGGLDGFGQSWGSFMQRPLNRWIVSRGEK
jgi:hypothetical protein